MTTFGKHDHFHDHLSTIAEAADRERQSRDDLRDLVAEAKAAGISWEAIGAALGMSKQAAWERFRL